MAADRARKLKLSEGITLIIKLEQCTVIMFNKKVLKKGKIFCFLTSAFIPSRVNRRYANGSLIGHSSSYRKRRRKRRLP